MIWCVNGLNNNGLLFNCVLWLFCLIHPVYYFVIIEGILIIRYFWTLKYVHFMLCHNYTKYIANVVRTYGHKNTKTVT